VGDDHFSQIEAIYEFPHDAIGVKGNLRGSELGEPLLHPCLPAPFDFRSHGTVAFGLFFSQEIFYSVDELTEHGLGIPQPAEGQEQNIPSMLPAYYQEQSQQLEKALLEIEEMKAILHAKTSPDKTLQRDAHRYEELKEALQPSSRTTVTHASLDSLVAESLKDKLEESGRFRGNKDITVSGDIRLMRMVVEEPVNAALNAAQKSNTKASATVGKKPPPPPRGECGPSQSFRRTSVRWRTQAGQ